MMIQLKAAGRQVEQLQRRLESIQSELSQARQLTAAHQARAETLEQQLSQANKAIGAKRKPSMRKPKPRIDL